MELCPDCGAERRALVCTQCDWVGERVGAIPVVLARTDARSPFFAAYKENYDAIAFDDLDDSIQHTSYLDAQTSKLLRYLGRLAGTSVCEVGIGQGRLFERLVESGVERAVGVDISVPYLQRWVGVPKAEVLVANAENVPFRDEFDIVVASDILEHVMRPGDFLLSARRALRPGGSLVVRVPLNEDIVRYARLAGCKYDFVHLRSFTRRQLRTMVTSAGFRVSSVHADGFQFGSLYAYRAYLWLRGRGLPRPTVAYPHRTSESAAVDGEQATSWRLAPIVASVESSLNRLPNGAGRLLATPLEVTVVATRP